MPSALPLAAAAIAGLAAITGAVLVARRYGAAMAAARAAVADGSRVAPLDAGPVEYAEAGSGPALLSIHGAGGGFDQGLAIAAQLVGEGVRVVAPSRFGYLRTPVPAAGDPRAQVDAQVDAQADAHAALLDHLGIDRAIVLGLSAGARSAVAFAVRHPQRVAALILAVPALHAPESPVAVDPTGGSRLAFAVVKAGGDLFWWALRGLAPSLVVRFVGVPPDVLAAADGAERARIAATIAAVAPLSARAEGIRIDSAYVPHDMPVERIAAPTLVITARDDHFNTLPAASRAAAGIRGARLMVFESGGHLLVGRTGEARAATRGFLAAHGLLEEDRTGDASGSSGRT